MSEESIFLEALQRSSPAERVAYLGQACAGNDALRREVENLLKAHSKAGLFLNDPAVSSGVTSDEPLDSGRPGAMIGPYKVLEPIGEGGFGIVYMAEQTEPIRRKVALKIIKPGMDTRQVIARFEAERQALSLMDHPNIAKVLDAGTTDIGRPYFVMELVKGQPITRYCDEMHLTPRQRLELFLSVCQAVQHAHQKGIIHRDVKPSNVLVAEYDGQPVAKVIDFGVAKAIGQPLTEKTVFTGFGHIVGTMEYMSPEQACVNQLDIDTRSDIYSLGVLIYELLTGATPFDKDRLRSAAWDEMLRVIREEDPPRPSTRLSDSKDKLASISALRRTEPAKLAKLLRGELDWIVMKALEKDRGRRYETASGFALDVQRYLADEPVAACPPSAGYRFKKFARRNRGALAIGAVAVIGATAIVIGLITGLWLLNRANLQIAHERDEAERQQQLAMNAVDDMYSDVAERWLKDQAGLQPVQREFLQKAIRYYEQFADKPDDKPDVRKKRGVAFCRVASMEASLGNFQRAVASHDKAIAIMENLVAEFPGDRDFRLELARAYTSVGVLVLGKNAERSLKRSIELANGLVADGMDLPEVWRILARSYNCLACVQDDPSRLADLEASTRQYLAYSEKLCKALPDDAASQWEVANAHNTLGELLNHSGRLLEAEQEYTLAVERMQSIQARSPTNPGWRECLATYSANVGEVLRESGRGQLAEKPYRRTIALFEKLIEEFPETHRYCESLASYVSALGDLLVELDRQKEAIEADRRVVAIRTKMMAHASERPQYRSRLAAAHAKLGRRLHDANQSTSAIAEFAKAIELDPDAEEFRWQLALAQAMARDLPGYRSTCAAMLDRFGRTEKARTASNVTWSLVLAPDTNTDLNQLLRLAEIEIKSRPSEFAAVTRGAALYRAGRYAEAIEQCNQANENRAADAKRFSPAAPWFFLAMAHHRLNHRQEALQWLDEAIKRAEREAQNPNHNELWIWRGTTQLLRGESEQLLRSTKPTREKPAGEAKLAANAPSG